MKLKQNQLNLINHLAQFEVLDYDTCLWILDRERANDRVKMSYAFRPLTKNKYLTKHKDGSVRILAKGRALFPDIKPLVTLGGGAAGVKRVISIARTAAFLRRAGVGSVIHPDMSEHWCFVPSACWRNIRTGILSTARFTGVLFIGEQRLAVYDIGDGAMEWQMKAERSLFYWKHSSYETKATGMLLICDEDKRNEVAGSIIRHTMWQRKQLIDKCGKKERDRPVQYSRAPIRVCPHFEHVYLSTPERLREDLQTTNHEKQVIADWNRDGGHCFESKQGDFDMDGYRYFINIATNLLKYVYFFATAKTAIGIMNEHYMGVHYAILLPRRDFHILEMYPDVLKMEGLKIYEYRPDEDTKSLGK